MIQEKAADILLVEDDAADATLTLRALKQRQAGGRVFHVVDGDEALEFMAERWLAGRTRWAKTLPTRGPPPI